MLKDGLMLMCIGMGTVFVFLCVMIVVLYITGFIMQKFAPEVQTAKSKENLATEDEVIAAIIATKAFAGKL